MFVVLYITRQGIHENALSQRLHWKGFSPVWVLWRLSLCLVFKTYYKCRNHDRLEYKMALKWLFPSVCSHVGVYVALLWECFVTMAALSWCLSSVSSLMRYKKIKSTRKSYHKGCSGFFQYKFRCWFTLGENFTTTETLWWSISSMCIPVVRYSSVETRWWPSISNRLHHWDRSEQTSYCIHGV